jgi:small subunit ribosomal protein S1
MLNNSFDSDKRIQILSLMAKKEEKPAAASKKATPAKKATPVAKKTTKKAVINDEDSDEPIVAEKTVKKVAVKTTERPRKVEVEKEIEKIEVVKEKKVFEKKAPVSLNEVKPIEDFNWNALNKGKGAYSEQEREELEQMYSSTHQAIMEHSLIDGTIVSKNKKEFVINVGYKSEGIISASEFRYDPDYKINDVVEVYVEQTEDKDGQLILSHQKARTLKAWDRVNKALEDQIIVKGFIKCRTKGGLIVDVFGLEAFLPGSQIDVKPIRDYDVYVGKTMDFKVVKINNEFRNVVVSHKALIEAELETQKGEIMSRLEKGQVLEGVVKNITSYGVFVDLGGVDGLIHITDLSWGRINHPEEIVQLDSKINVVILDFDDDKKRIALGLKQLSAHPWDALDKEYKVGDKLKGKIVVLADYGAFVEVAPGVEGLIHVSEMSWSQHLRTAQDFFKVGDEVEAVIMTLDRDERKMSLSTRQLTNDPWDKIESKFPIESKHKGKVTNLSNFGVFVELAEGIDGLIHISDLSWSKKINHPNEFTKVGNEIEVVVLEIDKENRRLSLGHKQLEQNPWDVFETVFNEGSVHKGTVISKNDKGVVVGLSYGVEGFCPTRHAVKQDGKKIVVEDNLDFEVIEFNKEAKKIILSHTKLFQEIAQEEATKSENAKKTKAKADSKAVKKNNDNLEKSTLGDFGVLSSLKEEMEQGEKKSKK